MVHIRHNVHTSKIVREIWQYAIANKALLLIKQLAREKLLSRFRYNDFFHRFYPKD